MIFGLHVYQRLAEGDSWEMSLPWARPSWRRTTRARGGYWTADTVITGLASWRLKQLYDTLIGKRVQEWSCGTTTWEGEIAEMALTLDGVRYQQSMDSEIWHNRVKVQYKYPRVDDVQQGALTYNPIANSFQDAGQDFSDWETLAGDAGWEITVTNNDGTTAHAYLGAAFATGAPDDSILVYTDVGLTTAGWDIAVGAKVPISYEVSNVLLAGQAQETGWAEQTDSTDIYGESEYIDVLADECYAAAAESTRDRRLVEKAYPRSLPAGGLSRQGEVEDVENSLSITCTGYAFGMNRRFYELTNEPLNVSEQLETLVNASEFVTVGSILENDTIQVPLDGADITTLIWDKCEGLIAMADTSGNRYTGGVYNGRKFYYDLAETDVLYQWRNGQLRFANGQIVPPTLIRPDIIVRLGAPMVSRMPGAEDWNAPTLAYIEEVEFIAPNSYRLIPQDGDILTGSA